MIKSKIIYCLWIFNLIFINANGKNYQDTFVNGEILAKGYGQNCQFRYDLIKSILKKKYDRPITVLDIGAAQGYFSFRIANDFDSTCVMIEKEKELTKLCNLNKNLKNIIHLKTKLTIPQLHRLAECEHFDFIMAFNIIHHFGSDWRSATDHICNLGETIIIETPPANSSSTLNKENLENIENYIKKLGGKLIAQEPRWSNPELLSNIYLIERKKNHTERTYWAKQKNLKKSSESYKIISTKKEKKFSKTYHNITHTTDWIKGINLLTFKMLNGVYPESNILENEIYKLKNYKNLRDCFVHNLVIQGHEIKPIDLFDPRREKTGWECNQQACDLIIRILRIQDRNEIKNLYNKYGMLPLPIQKFE